LIPVSAASAPPAKEKKGREFNFDTDEVMVDVLKPDAAIVAVLRDRKRKSLIRIRMDFIKEIVRSAEDI
jgi:hypothetical protein